jgi:polyhydroxyalkanoate synthase
MEYLRGLCQRNEFATEGFEVLGEKLHISGVKVPLCAIACETDHIAAWKTSYDGIRKMGSRSKTFILSESGHIAGIVNPPSKKKYGHYMNTDWPETASDWYDTASFHEGSWWPHWEEWLRKRSGTLVAARAPGAKGREILAEAPGTYVVSSTK